MSVSFGDINYYATYRVDRPLVTGVPLTISCWVYPTDATPTNARYIFSLTDQTKSISQANLLELEVANLVPTLGFRARGGGGTVFTASLPSVLEQDKWSHICCVVNSATDRKLFYNYTQQATSTNSAVITTGFRTLTIGAKGFEAGGAAFVGHMRDFAIWSTGLTATHVESLYNGASPLNIVPEKLASLYPLVINGSPQNDIVGGKHAYPPADTTSSIDFNLYPTYNHKEPSGVVTKGGFVPVLPAFESMTLWLDAADSGTITLDSNGKVQTWRDKIRGLEFTQATSSVRPTLASGGIEFINSVGGFLQPSPQVTLFYNEARHTNIFVVYESRNRTNHDALFTHTLTNAWTPLYSIGNNDVFFGAGTNIISSQNPEDTHRKNLIRAHTQSSAYRRVVLNGGAETVNTTNYNPSYHTVTVGGDDRISNFSWGDGIIYEILCYWYLTEAQASGVEDYLAAKWNISLDNR